MLLHLAICLCAHFKYLNNVCTEHVYKRLIKQLPMVNCGYFFFFIVISLIQQKVYLLLYIFSHPSTPTKNIIHTAKKIKSNTLVMYLKLAWYAFAFWGFCWLLTFERHWHRLNNPKSYCNQNWQQAKQSTAKKQTTQKPCSHSVRRPRVRGGHLLLCTWNYRTEIGGLYKRLQQDRL